MTKIIGLTGGIGSGKTTVAKQFEALGVPVYIADSEAKILMGLPETLALVKNEFGNSVFDEDILNREKLAKIVFKDAKKLQKLNSIIHPLVKKHFQNWLKQNKDAAFVIKETAILFESGSYKDCDKIITVIAPLEIRIERVLKRDGSGYEDVVRRIENQWNDERRIAKTDYVVENLNIENTNNQVAKLYEVLKNV